MPDAIFNGDWFSLQWFYLSTLRDFEWVNAWALFGILLLPLIFFFRWLFSLLTAQKLDTSLPRKDIRIDPSVWLRFVPYLFLSIALALLFVALARPQRSNERVEQWTEGIDIMLVIDISQSMQIEDFLPNRLESAKNVARDFISGRFQDRIGLVVFSGDAFSLSPLTTDYELLYNYIDEIDFDMIENRGTAIGSALAVGTNRMRESEGQSKVMILLSDGDNTAGNIDPITAAELAAAFGIKIYTIAIGKEGKVPFGKDFFGRTQYINNTLDESTLREIAAIGDGRFYRVSNNQALEEVFAIIDEFEKAEIKETRFKNITDFYYIYVYWAVLFLLLWVLSKSTFVSNILAD